MEGPGLEGIEDEVDSLVRDLERERARAIAGVETEPAIARLFTAHPKAAHRATVSALRGAGNNPLAELVAALRAERAASEHEESWRAAEARAFAIGPEGPLPLAALELAIPREPDRARRKGLADAAATALEESASSREAMLEVNARAGAEVGLVPDWQAVVAGDELLAATDDAYRDVLRYLARRDPSLVTPAGGLSRADLLRLLALVPWDGLFRQGALTAAVRATAAPLRLDLDRIAVDEGDRRAQWPGVHVTGPRISFRPRSGAGDWQDLLEALGRALAAAHAPPHRRTPALGNALGWLLGSLLLEPRWLLENAGVERRHAADVRRDLALRRLMTLRAKAAAFRVASEVRRGLSGVAWRVTYRDALTEAVGATWDAVRAGRDGDAAEHAALLQGAGAGEWLRATVREQFDEDWWRNPRTAQFLAGLLAAGVLPDTEDRRDPARAAGWLVRAMEAK